MAGRIRAFFSRSRSLDRILDYKSYRGRQLRMESLEERQMLSINLTGVADWFDQGSSPMVNTGNTSDPNSPAGGAVEAVAVDPGNSAHIYVGTVNGGIWRTTNGTRPFDGFDNDGVNGIDDALEQPTWTPLTDQFASLAIGDLKFDPLDPTGNTIFAGTGSASSLGVGSGGTPIGVMKSTDDGNTWSVFPVNPGGTEPVIRSVLPTTFDTDAVTPGVQQAVLVGTTSNTGVYRSTDGGQSYSPISGSNGLPTGSVTHLIADPNNASRVFVGVAGQGVYRSNDGGANWTTVNTNLTNLGTSTTIALAAHPGGGTTVVYAIISGPTPAVFSTTNGGTSWNPLAALPAAFTSTSNNLYDRAAQDQIVVDPSNSQIVYISKGYGGSGYIYRYNPAGGGSWVQIESGGASGNTRPHVDNRDLEFINTNILVSANDGGIYFLPNPQNAANNRWTSLHGRGSTGLSATEYHNIAWDSRFNVTTGGAQDNGTSVQNATNDPVWTQYQGADGGDVQVDTVNAGAGRVFRYASSQNFGATFMTPYSGGFQRHTFDSATNEPIAAVDLITMAGLANFNAPFVPQYELNAVDLNRLVTGGGGTSPVYELLNAPTAANAAAANWQAVPVGAGFGSVSTLAVGGRFNSTDNAEVLVAGSGSAVYLRSTAGGTLTATPTSFPGGSVQDIVLDPENWQHFFVADSTNVYETTDAGMTWNDLTRNLGVVNNRLQSIEFIPTAGLGAIIVGGNLGVSKLLLDSPADQWTRFGSGLPNALAMDLDYDPVDDVLIAGTFGRGVFSVDNASIVVEDSGVLNICGDEDHVNQDDVITLIRNAMNPLVLDVFLNSVMPTFSVALALVEQINVFGVGGNDTLIVDSSNGLINIPDGIRFDGDGACPDEPLGFGYDRGIDTLQLAQTDGTTWESHTITVGASVGQGISTIVGAGAGNVQTIFFEELEPVVDNVPAMDLIVNGALIGSLLNGANQITYDQSDLFPATSGRITVDAFEPIHFSNKTNLTIDAENGDDTVVLNNAALPTGLETITVEAENGNDRIDLLSLPDAASTSFVSATINAGAGNDTVDASLLSAITPLTINGSAGNDTLIGGPGSDSISGGDGNDTLVGNGSNNNLTGGAGIDTQLIQGTNLNDEIDIRQQNATTVMSTVNGDLRTDTLSSIERLRVELLDGDDAVRVTHDDSLVVTPSQSLPVTVVGAAPNASDILVVNDDGMGDTVVHRIGADGRSGTVSVGPLAPIAYETMESVFVLPLDPITGGTGADGMGRLVVFKYDPFEPNNAISNATFLGAGPTVNVDPTIDPGAGPFGIPGDNDFFQFVAQETGVLDLQLYFKHISTLANGRAGLPGNGELQARIYDSDGLPMAIATASDLLDPVGNKIGERVDVPVVRNQTYFLRVEGQSVGGTSGINVYNFTGIVTAAPIPELVDLQAASDSGRNNTDNITKFTTPTFNIILDDDRIDEFANIDLSPDTVNDDLPTVGFDYGVEVFNNAVSIGYAYYTGVGNTWEFTATAGDINEGDFNHISAAVWIRDAANPAQLGRHTLSQALQIELDTIVPPVSFGLPDATNAIDGLAADSDTGVTTDPATYADRITSDTTPRLWGRAEADSIVSVYLDRNGNGIIDLATDTFLGQTVAVPLDGNNAYPEGYWELVTALDLNEIVGLPKDGLRSLLVTGEDVAGNPMPMGGIIDAGVGNLQIFLDTQGPQVTDVTINRLTPSQYDLFDPKPSTDGPTPLVNSITIKLRDLPTRLDQTGTLNDFIYSVLDPTVAAALGNYSVIGDHVGNIAIQSVAIQETVKVAGTVTAAVNATQFDAAGFVGAPANLRPAVGDFILFNNGGAANQLRRVTAYNAGTGAITVDSAYSVAPAVGNGFSVVTAASLAINGVTRNTTPLQTRVTTAGNTTSFTAANMIGAPAAQRPNIGDYLLFNTGPSQGQLRRVTAFNATTGLVTVDSALPAAPLAGDEFTLVTGAVLNTASVTLNFVSPLPDDRFTVRVLDALVDPVGNKLDGESNATQPLEIPTFPSGNHIPGGDFVARFTIDTRPEIGTYVAQNISIDINGNFVWDPANGQIGNDATNVDLSFTLPVEAAGGGIGLGGYNVHDLLFAGRFSLTQDGLSDGFDTLAAFGHSAELGVFRWIVDRNHDGVVSPALGDILTTQPLLANFNVPGAIPVAGNFSGGALSDDEIGLYNQGKWAFDTNKNFVIDPGEVFTNGMFGHPIVGDFDGDGLDDLAVFNNNQLFFNFAVDGLIDAADQVIVWGYPGVLDRPVAADMDRDGIDDIGLWVPRSSSATPPLQSEWYFLISDDNAGVKRVTGSAVTLNHPFTPVPFGNDLYAEFGDDLALPIVGNFDPPVAAQSVNPQGGMDGDYDGDGDVDGSDFLTWQRSFGSTQNMAADGDHSGIIDAGDLTMWSDAYPHSSSPPATSSDLDGDGDVDGRDFLMLQRSPAATSSGVALANWQAQYGAGSSSLVAALTVEENNPSTTSLASASEPAPAVQPIADSPALFWLSLPEQSSAHSEADYYESLAESQVEQARVENQTAFAAALNEVSNEEVYFSTDENEADADFELVLDEAFNDMGV